MDSDQFDIIFDENPELTGLTIMGTEDIVHIEASEHEHYLILPDPLADSDQRDTAWSMLLLQDPYKDMLVRVTNIIVEDQDLQYDWEPVYLPDSAEPEDHTHFVNYLTGCIADHIMECQDQAAIVYRDERGKVIEQ